MIRTSLTAAALALCAPVMAQPAMTALEIDPVVLADATCALFKNPSIPQSKKDEMRENIYIRMPGVDLTSIPEALRSMHEGYAIVRERGCGQ